MRRDVMKRLTLTLGLALMVAACSDDKNTGGQDATVKPDAKADRGVQDAGKDVTIDGKTVLKPDKGRVVGKMGEGCSSARDCDEVAPLCLIPDDANGLGICSAECTPDDPTTPLVNEESCPEGFACGTFSYTSADYHYCLKKCTPSLTTNSCPASSKRACAPGSTRYTDLDIPVCWFLTCKDGKDCPVNTSQACTTDANCNPSLATDAYCDTSLHTCARPGNCTAAGICGPHALGKAGAKVGDACTADFDCSNNGTCLTEAVDASYIGIGWRNGYCGIFNCAFDATLPEYKCPTGSTCNHLYYSGLCMKTCKLDVAADCRSNPQDKGGDYECYDWSGYVIGGSTPVTAGPVCMTAAGQTCDGFSATSDCASLGDPNNNPTNMKCRDRFTGAVKTDPRDPKGVCLDDTASGSFEAPTDGGGVKVDGGTHDAAKGN
jgi:hypothetical protein